MLAGQSIPAIEIVLAKLCLDFFKDFVIDDCLVLRSYTYRQFEALVRKVPEWSIETAYDFSYDIDEPIEIDESTEDIVYILKRK